MRLLPALITVWGICLALPLASPRAAELISIGICTVVALTVVNGWIRGRNRLRRARVTGEGNARGGRELESEDVATVRRIIRTVVVATLVIVAPASSITIAAESAHSASDALTTLLAEIPDAGQNQPPQAGCTAAPAGAPSFLLSVRTTGRPRSLAPGFSGESRWLVAARTESIRGEPSDVPILLITEGLDAVRPGTALEIDATLRPTNPGTREIAWVSARSQRVLPEAGERTPLDRLTDGLDGLRIGLVRAAAPLPGSSGTLLPGLAIGETSELPEDLDQAMRDTGLTHLVAVSGANCAVVIAGASWLAALLGAGRRLRIAIGLTVLGGFVLLVGPDPSVLRAAVMATIVLIFLIGGRPGRGFPVLCAAATLLLLTDPGLARDFGFALSVAATAGILLLSAPLEEFFARWLPGWLSLALALPLAAQLACGPILILLRPEISLTAIPANFLAAPAAPIATVLGLLACLAQAVWPPAGLAFAWAAWLPTAWIIAVARTLSALPGTQLPWLPGLVGALCLLLVTALLLGLLLHRARRVRWGIALAMTLALVAVIAILPGSLARAGVPRNWSIAACDVGQGDAVLVRSAGRVALIDAGPNPDALSACLSLFGVSRIALFVLTHFDSDHAGGLSAIAGRVDTALIAAPRTPGNLETARSLGAVTTVAREGDTGTLGTLRWNVFWPPAPRAAPAKQIGAGHTSVDLPGLDMSPNDAGVVWGFRGEGMSAVFLADLGAGAQSMLLPVLTEWGLAPGTDIVKVAHHGSADQDPELYRAIRPRFALISVGARNGYGHPRREIIEVLARGNVRTGRTDTDGAVLILNTPDGPRLSYVGTERGK